LTCIAAFVDHSTNQVWMGADSIGISDYDASVRADEKLFFNGDFLIGFCGSFRGGQIMRYHFEPPRVPAECGDLDRFMVRDFIGKLRETYRSVGFTAFDDGREVGSPGGVLVAWRDRLWCMYDDFQIGSTRDGLYAVGLGRPYAIAALASSFECAPQEPPAKRLDRALRISAHFSAGVRPPFHILSTAQNK